MLITIWSVSWKQVWNDSAGDMENGVVFPDGEIRHVGPFKSLLNASSFAPSAFEREAYKSEQYGVY